MDVVLFRKLTWKSVIKFGKYKDLSIQQIYNLGHTQYLRYLYYNMESISFIDEILGKINVFGLKFDYRIKKPGTNIELFDKINRICFNKQCKKVDIPKIITQRQKKVRKANYMLSDRKDKSYFSKAAMQARNQGHF
jgi:hypothetical protein